MNKFMRAALIQAKKAVDGNHGGPFGAVVVKNGKIIGKGHNSVVKNNDATCHGEIQAIRSASKALKSFDLTGCTLYTTGEPCPMCLCACLWANIDKVYYACTLEDNKKAGFRDSDFDDLMGGREKLKNYLSCIDRQYVLPLFEEYQNKQNTIKY